MFWLWLFTYGAAQVAGLYVTSCINSTDCEVGKHCHQNICIPCVDCILHYRHAKSECASSFDECGNCINGYVEPLVTNFVSFKKRCVHSQKLTGKLACFDCALYNRHGPQYSSCAKQPNECGPCIEGYYELLVTDSAMVKPCKAERQSALSGNTENQSDSRVALGTVCTISVAVVALVAFVVLAVAYTSRNITAIATVQNNIAQASPRDTVEEELVEERTVLGGFKEQRETQNMAILCRAPNAPYYPQPYTGPEMADEDLPDAEPNEGNILLQDEEATVPSSWSPNPTSSTTTGEPYVASFTGVLSQINGNSISNPLITNPSFTGLEESPVDEGSLPETNNPVPDVSSSGADSANSESEPKEQ